MANPPSPAPTHSPPPAAFMRRMKAEVVDDDNPTEGDHREFNIDYIMCARTRLEPGAAHAGARALDWR